MTEAVADLAVERLVRLDERIDANEVDALRSRWEFGRLLLAARDGKGRLPNRYLADLVVRTGKNRVELSRRARFAERFPSEEELCHAVTQFGSWHQVVQSLKVLDVEGDAAAPTDARSTLAEGQFSTFVADPPWRYGNTSTRGAAEDHYPTMSIDELCELDVVRDRAADQAHLYLWATAGHFPDAFQVMDAWGFDYKTYLVWIKPQMGMGNYFRVSTEIVLFGVRGGMRTNHRGLMNYFQARRGKHSSKPAMFHDLVMKASPGPYLEMFSRCQASTMLMGCTCAKCRLGWSVWGNQS